MRMFPYALGRGDLVLVSSLAVVAAAAWFVVVRQADMSGGSAVMLTAPSFLVMWFVMMIAMMLPSATPMIITFHRISRTKHEHGAAFVGTWVYVAAYLLVWTVVGGVAYAATLGIEALTSASGSMDALARLAGGLILLAGLYQFTPLKHLGLSKCRAPLDFIHALWRDGPTGSLWMGLEHGFYCVVCCWLLFAVLLPLGTMNLGAMVAITLLIFVEKTLAFGLLASRVAGGILVAYGVFVLISPAALMPAMVM